MVDHGKNTKRKKFHDKDKYYKLAKEQGLRSRAAFKLSQINRHYPLLHSKTNVVLDLCAAPGGWTQVVGRTCGPQTAIIAVDILPIRSLGKRNITTIVGDITTEKCKADINRAITESAASLKNSGGRNNHKNEGTVDVVLHDGAPNVGASYDKDAYMQTELAVHALRCATQHLRHMGSFVTKIYRSKDSASFQWVCKQLFREVTTFKPKASRQQSAEIFYVCQGYYKPDKIDPRLLDPKHIFEFVEGDTQGGGKETMGGADKKFNVFHKSWDAAKRQRGGYDTDHLDGTMRHIEPVSKFVFGDASAMAAIQTLSTCTGMSFRCDDCDSMAKLSKKKDKSAEVTCPKCSFLVNHPFTTSEIKACVVDLKLLNKGDFKGLVLWREKMLTVWKAQQKAKAGGSDDDDSDSDSDDSDDEDSDGGSAGEDDEDAIQKEIQKARERKLREKKKAKKKERKLMAKKRRQAAFGMDLNAIEIQEHDQFFSLATLQSKKDLNAIAEVNLDKVTEEEAFGRESDDEDDEEMGGGANFLKNKGLPDVDDTTGYSFRLESELDAAYDRFLAGTKNGENKIGTKAAKRSKKLMREKLAQESHEDQELLLAGKKGVSKDMKAYAKMLQGGKDSDDDSDESDDEEGKYESDDGFDDEPMTPAEYEAKQKQQKDKKEAATKDTGAETSNPLIHEFPDDPAPMKTARWFSNPLFAEIGQAVNAAASNDRQKSPAEIEDPLGDDDDDDISPDSESDEETKKPPAKKARKDSRKDGRNRKQADDDDDDKEKKITADDVLAMMPKTDKQKRHEKRIKARERDERRQARRAKQMGEEQRDFDLVPRSAENEDEDEFDDDELMQMEGMSEEKKQKIKEARKLIKAGMGKNASSKKGESEGFEVVEADRPLPTKDDRKYNSDNEEYDSDDHAETLALGTMMLRHSKAKSLVDASYNRFAWNDPSDLPEWFVDDENRNYRPQLPIPPALLAKMKEKMIALSTKPIAKVAEARARKNRKAKLKLAAAKKKAQAVANSSEMSEAMKLKSISKALRSDDRKGSGKSYVVSKKGQGKKGVKGSVMVDKRMKNDKRGMERAAKKRKNGKKGGLTGSKRRRNHK
jgi:AdoMet-dependent rRNA methyltransferase SPB1